MKEGVLYIVVGLLIYIRPAFADSKIVWVKDMTTRFEANKRTNCDLDLLDDLTFRVGYRSNFLTLNLKKTHGNNRNDDIYVLRNLKEGRSLLEQTPSLEKENLAYYQDRENNAAMIVRCAKRKNGQYERIINGNIRLGDRNYELRPVETDIELRHVDVADLLGTPYILHEQSRIRTDISAKNNDKKNKVRSVYWVEIAVLIDSSVLNLFSRLVETNGVQDKDALVQSKLREAFSLYIQGVNLLYSEIDDHGIDISISLRTFFFFKPGKFKHVYSKVTTHKGKSYIDADDYMMDLKHWDKTICSKLKLEFDHAMLFTRHDLFTGSITNNDISGVSERGHVCDQGKRISIIEMGDFFTTVTNAAHELAHNLGAFHDGEEDAKDCDPDDEFIMAPEDKEFHENEPYTRNPWSFSNCSIESFKKTLQNKTCVTNKGVFFNNFEWMNYVAKEPGEVYTLNKQCALINGPNSKSHGGLALPAEFVTVSFDYTSTNTDGYSYMQSSSCSNAECTRTSSAVSPATCLFMKCTDPKTGQSMSAHFSAARGTTCGTYMWCIEGMCVAKDLK